MNRDPKKHRKGLNWLNIFPDPKAKKKTALPVLTPEQMVEKARVLNAAFGGRVVRREEAHN